MVARSTSRSSPSSRATMPEPVFSFMGRRALHPAQRPCWITHTNARTHEIIRGGLDRSPMYAGVIKGVGPRYCPSIEDKVVRFAQRDSHQIYLEPEGLDTHEIYPNGISTSLPFDVQHRPRPLDARLRERAHPAAGLRDRVRLLRPARAARDARDEGDPRALLRRPDQRHDRLRGGGGAGAARRAQRRAARPGRGRLVPAPRRGLPRRAGRRPHHARRVGAVPDVHVARGVPAFAARGQRRPPADRARPSAGPRRRRPLGRVLPQARRDRGGAGTARRHVRRPADRPGRRSRKRFWGKGWSESMRSPTCCAARA